MADIAIRKQDGDKPATVTQRSWDPWRTMRSLLSWDPFRDVATLPALEGGAFAVSPAFDVKETKEAYEFKADVPGVQEKDLEVSMTGDRLIVSRRREAEKEDRGDRCYTYERSFGSFARSFSLPDGADAEKVHASLDKGGTHGPSSEEARSAAQEGGDQVREFSRSPDRNAAPVCRRDNPGRHGESRGRPGGRGPMSRATS